MISASPLIVQLPPFSPNPQRPPPNRVRLSAAADRADFYEGEATAVNGYGRRRCGCFDLYKELVPYKEAWSWQKSLVRKRHSLIDTNEDHCDMLIILQHPPVYTLGTGSLEKYLNFNIQNAPYDVYRTERGGEVTYHGPGQFMQGYNCSECTYELYQGLVERRRYLSILLLTAEWRNMIHVDDPK